MSEGKSINKVDVFGNAINVAFNLVWPVGVTYPQYPGEKSPMDLWGEFSTWEPINYNGAFFRAAGGNANPWIEVTTTNGRNFTIKEGRAVPLNSALKYGATVMFNGESRTVNNVVGSGSNITSFDVNSAFTEPSGGYKNITNVYILQDDATDANGLSVKTTEDLTGYVQDWLQGKNASSGIISHYSSEQRLRTLGNTVSYQSFSGISIDANHTHILNSNDDETRPINSTFLIWRRIE